MLPLTVAKARPLKIISTVLFSNMDIYVKIRKVTVSQTTNQNNREHYYARPILLVDQLKYFKNKQTRKYKIKFQKMLMLDFKRFFGNH